VFVEAGCAGGARVGVAGAPHADKVKANVVKINMNLFIRCDLLGGYNEQDSKKVPFARSRRKQARFAQTWEKREERVLGKVDGDWLRTYLQTLIEV
jgi:hypothetical protein